jgi:hypothetical protein
MSEGITFGEATVAGEPVETTVSALSVDDDGDGHGAIDAPKPMPVEEVIEADDPDALAAEAEDLSLDDQLALINKYFPLPEDFPSEEQIKEWDETYGRLRIHRIAPGEAYVVRALSRAEFRQYLAILKKKFATVKEVDAAEERMVQEELLVERCTLYPTVTAADIRGESTPIHKIGLAGTVSVLAFDIQEISNLNDNAVGPFEEV